MTSCKTCVSLLMLVLSAAATSPAEAADLEYTDCAEQTALLLLPAALMPALPPGFVYTTPAGDSLQAAIHISGASCKSVDGGGPTKDMFVFALVKPPAALTVPEVPFYAIALGGYTSRPDTLARFSSWGITDLLESATVDVELSSLPLARLGKVEARSPTSSLTTQMNAVGTPRSVGGGHVRAYYVRGGRLIASFDAVYTPQKGLDAVGTVVPTGCGFLPNGVYPAVGSHAFDYDLTVGLVKYY